MSTKQSHAEAGADKSDPSVKRRADLVSAAAAALLLPYGYSLAYAYAFGQAAYWGIPTDFISVAWEASLAALSAVIGLFFVAAFIAFVMPEGIRKLPQIHLFTMLLVLSVGLMILGFPIILILGSFLITAIEAMFCLGISIILCR